MSGRVEGVEGRDERGGGSGGKTSSSGVTIPAIARTMAASASACRAAASARAASALAFSESEIWSARAFSAALNSSRSLATSVAMSCCGA